MVAKTYGRGQLEWALWCSFIRSRVDIDDVPKVFRTRIKRLLEIDRNLDVSNVEAQSDADYAFAPDPDPETLETAYSAVDGLCLAIALDLLDAGFKQAEIVFLLRYLRSELEVQHSKLVAPPSLTSRQRYPADRYPDLPFYQHKGRRFADKRVFAVLQKVEVKEVISPAQSKRHTGPVFLEPIFRDGVTALCEELNDLMPNRRRAVTVIEVAALAESVEAFLEAAPDIHRGRPKA